MFNQTDSQMKHNHERSWFFLRVGMLFSVLGLLMLPPSLLAGELRYAIQSQMLGGNSGAFEALENARATAVKQAKEKVRAEERRLLQEAERDAAATPEARFLSSLQSQIYFAISQQIASSITSLDEGASGSFQTGDNVVGYTNNGGILTVTVTSPTGTSVMELPTVP